MAIILPLAIAIVHYRIYNIYNNIRRQAAVIIIIIKKAVEEQRDRHSNTTTTFMTYMYHLNLVFPLLLYIYRRTHTYVSFYNMSAFLSSTPSVTATIVSTKKTFKLSNINAQDTFEHLKEVIISQLYSKTLMKTKYLRVIVNGKEIDNAKLQITTLNVKNKKKIPLY